MTTVNLKGLAHCRLAGGHEFGVQGVGVGHLRTSSCFHVLDEFKDELWLLVRLCMRCGHVAQVGQARHCVKRGWYLIAGYRRRTVFESFVMGVKSSDSLIYEQFESLEELMASPVFMTYDLDILDYHREGDLQHIWFVIRDFYEDKGDLLL